MKLIYVCMATLFLVASLIAFADNVEVTEIKDNKGGVYQATELEEKGKFFHDRDYTITNIPKEFLGLTQVSTSADCPGGQDYNLTFNIDRPAYVYTAWDSRHKRPEDRGQDPKGWFTKTFTETDETLFLDAPHDPTEYFIYKSNEPYEDIVKPTINFTLARLGMQIAFGCVHRKTSPASECIRGIVAF